MRIIAIVIISFCLSACLFPVKPGPHLGHFEEQAPNVGEPAPRFTLANLDGEAVSLDSLIGEKPIVLQIGSHSCPVYRFRRFSMRRLHEKYKDDVTFLLIYVQEAHPVGSNSPYVDKEWVSFWNKIPGVLIPQHKSHEERLEQARQSKEKLQKYYKYTYLVDDINNTVWTDYGSASSPAFVIDTNGDVALKQVWVRPGKIDKVLSELLDV